MKSKKLAILLVLVVCLVAVIALTACKSDDLTTAVFKAYAKVTEAKQIKQTIVVSGGSEELAKTELTYDMASGKVSETTTTVDAATPVTSTKDFNKSSLVAPLKADSFTGELTVNEASKTVKGSLTADNAKTLLGADSTVSGNVIVTFKLGEDGNLASLEVSYATANGNNVLITTTYTF